ENFTGQVLNPTFGGGDKAVTIGGEKVLPYLSFEGDVPNKPVMALEIQDIVPVEWPDVLKKIYDGVSDDPVKWAKFCQDELKAKAIALRLLGTHPDQKNRSPEEAARTVKDVLAAVDVPLIIMGSNHIEKDAAVLVAASDAAKGRNCVIGKAQEGNYKTIAASAMASGHKMIAMADLDINLSKQLNILITQMGFPPENLISDPMCSALGYGLEYTYSVMERIRLAALAQNDVTMQPPMLGDVGMYVWKAKEAAASEQDLPDWGSLEERAIAWEVVTAMGMIMAGTELLVMRHPKSIETVNKAIDELISGG
ncbi:MAG TPA: acetyl-CoA decarbonylase/synthase complex subunit delta, partial [Thermodesulfovibrionia bacterium]|nr:acetyl-CoA decarbonylase/synthase complex subunit delta [Thermodesulfovibrionia bacterium]